MPTNLFEVEGIDIGHSVNVLAGVDDPSVGLGVVAPVGSMYLRTNGQTFKKTGVADTAWTLDVSAGIDDDSAYVLKTRSIITMDTYEVEVDVGVVSFNHYYETGVQCKVQSPTYYQHNIIVKNLSGCDLEIVPLVGRIEGNLKYTLHKKMSAVTLAPLQNDWIITSFVEGYVVDHTNSHVSGN